jgi:hypothetical protein
MLWLFIGLLLAITILAGLQLDSLYRIQAMNASLLEIAFADSSKKSATEFPLDLTEAIKRSSSHTSDIASAIGDLRSAICGSYQRAGLGSRHQPGVLEDRLNKIVKGLADVELAISFMESRTERLTPPTLPTAHRS